jgi:type IV secretion system protein VirB10
VEEDTQPKKERPEELPIRERPKPVTRLNRKVIVVGVLFVGGVTTVMILRAVAPGETQLGKKGEPIITQKKIEYPEFLQWGPKDYQQLTKKPERETLSEAAAAVPEVKPARQGDVQGPPGPQPGTTGAAKTAAGPPTKSPAPPVPRTPQATAGPARQPQSAKKAPEPKPKKTDWLFAKVEQGKGVEEPKDGQAEEKAQKPTIGDVLFPTAKWATPLKPPYVLYRSQLIPAILLHDVNSDIAGDIHLMVTADIIDKFQSGVVLIPQNSYIHGQQEGQPKYGQQRLNMKIESLEFPDGTVMTFAKAKAGDQSGAVGIPGSVNNHYGQVLLSAVLTAVLSVGTRTPFGSTSGFQQSLPQEFAQDAAQSLNRTGQRIVERSLQVNPTIELEYGTPVQVHLGEAISMMTEPGLAWK